MRGIELREMREKAGLKAVFVAVRAGYSRSQLNKIEKKKDVSVEEFERFTKAMGHKPGDLLENSLGDVRYPESLQLLRRMSAIPEGQRDAVMSAIFALLDMREQIVIEGSRRPDARRYDEEHDLSHPSQ
jgi:transcriptional regulator with XRE-family HTH domain